MQNEMPCKLQTQSRVLPGTAALSLEGRPQGSLGGQACHEGNAVFMQGSLGGQQVKSSLMASVADMGCLVGTVTLPSPLAAAVAY